jgi:membrane protein DedA with SNARE-associated domain
MEVHVEVNTGAQTEAVERRERLNDRLAFGLLAAWFIFRAVANRLGFGAGPRFVKTSPWVIPLLNNSSLLLITAGTGTTGRPGLFALAMVTSVFMSTVAGLILYWAGWRFGHRLAEKASNPTSPWAGVWNPKQIARAERWMDRWGIAVIAVARITEFFIAPITLVAGASEMRLRRFLLAHTIGAVGFAGLFLWIGSVAQRRWPWLQGWITDVYGPWALRIGIGLIVLLVVLMGLGSLLGKSEKVKKAEGRLESEEPSEAAPATEGTETPTAPPAQD